MKFLKHVPLLYGLKYLWIGKITVLRTLQLNIRIKIGFVNLFLDATLGNNFLPDFLTCLAPPSICICH